MTGATHLNPLAKEAILRHMSRLYPEGMFRLENFEDLILATPNGRKDYADIGLGEIGRDLMVYVLENLHWINICLFVNSDFRECFSDAIMIEQALLQVSRSEYLDFREEMEMDSENSLPSAVVPINFAGYDSSIDGAIGNVITEGISVVTRSGTMDAYQMLLKDLSGDALEKTRFAIYHLVYLVNALQYNGVFRKYVKIVVENVKKQLVPDYEAAKV